LIPLDKADRSRQSSIWVDGEEYLIQTAFPYWISFENKLRENRDIPLSEFDYLYKEGIPENRKGGYEELHKFYVNKQPLPRDTGETGKNIIDFDIDSERIYCAFLEKYNINLITTNLHWHDFQALYFNIFYPLVYVISCRQYEKPKKLTQSQREAEDDAKGKKDRYAWELETEKKEAFKMR